MKQLRPYQIKATNEIAQKYTNGYRKLVFQLATGGGKSVTFAALIHRFTKAINKKVVIAVHREELLQQARQTLYNWYGIIAEPIVAGVKYRNPNAQVYVTMVETANNRLKKNPKFFGEVGLVIIDEAHLGNFTKLHSYFDTDPTTLIVGFTATPISSSKKFPLNGLYQDIVCGIDIPDLIGQGSLVANRTYHIKGSVDRKGMKVKNGEFDNADMFQRFGSTKHIENCVDAYEKHAKGTKTIVFNCNVEHSKLVTEAFIARGYSARHLDGTMPEHERKAVLNWFAQTPDAILNNIGILTTGFDEPSVVTVIVNRATMSLPLWLQMTGRGSRPFLNKRFFTILDLGGNAITHGDWRAVRDWSFVFHNPDKPSDGGGVAPIKSCEHCEAIMPASARICPECGEEQTVETAYDQDMVELELLTENIDVAEMSKETVERGYNNYFALHHTKSLLINKLAEKHNPITDAEAYKVLGLYQSKVQEWCSANGKLYNQWHKETTAGWLMMELKRVFNWEPQVFELQL